MLDAKQYDAARERRRRIWIVVIIVVLLVGGWVAYHLRYYPERRAVAQFFGAIQRHDYETAYGIWFHDPAWRQHPNQFVNYPYNEFYRDWGPGGEWGLVKSYHVDCSLGPGNGVIVQVTVNQRADHAYMFVDKANKTLTFAPNEIQCGNWFGWLTE